MRILIIENDEAVIRSESCILEAFGFETRSVTDGAAALDAARSLQPDLILCDVFLRGKDGLGLLKELRHDPELASVPVIMTCSSSYQQYFRAAMNLGADDVLHKPFTIKDLMRSVSLRLGKRGHGQNRGMRNRGAIPSVFKKHMRTILGFSKLLAGAPDDLSRDEIHYAGKRIHASAKRLRKEILSNSAPADLDRI